ncbi:YafY family transcriptional regulator [Yimella sp. cx-573]|nr:YafY family transcriptional regulator [Yimella sp. cx-573]
MATTQRTLELLGLFQAQPIWTAPELAARLDVTERTVRRDVDRLRELGYAIDAARGAAGGYRLRRGSVLPPLLLTQDEAVAVSLCLRTAGLNGLIGADQDEAALRAAVKLERLLPTAPRARVQRLSGAIRAPQREQSSVDSELLTTLADAVAGRQPVRFDYNDRRGTTASRRAEPHELVPWRRHWYLSAYDLDREAWRIFRIDRISRLHATTFAFRARTDAPDVVTQLASREPATYEHRVELLVEAPIEQLAGYADHLTLERIDDHTTRMTAGADDADSAAWWVLQLEYPFRLIGDEDVRAALVKWVERATKVLAS